MSKRNKIAPSGLFFMLYISRVVVSLTNVQSVTLGAVSTDILISLVISLFLTLIFSLPVIYCFRFHKNPLDIKWLGFLYFLFFIFAAGVNVSRFSYFASTTLNPQTQGWLFALFIALCSLYAASLGIEAMSRFCAFAFSLMFLAVITILLSNIKGYEEINLYPVVNNNTKMILRNALILSSNTPEIIIFSVLSDKINGSSVKSFVSSVTAAFLTIFLLLLFMIAIMGENASLQSFPLYNMFQLSKISNFERLDIIHISYWILAVFVKTALLIYCSSISIKPFKNKNKCIASGVGVFLLSLFFINTGLSGNIKPVIIMIPFFVFCVIIPLLTLIFKKRNKGEELAKMF